MNKQLSEYITFMREHIALMSDRIRLAEQLLGPIELSEGAEYNFFGSTLWVTTSNRDDVTKLLALAPAGKHWAKDRSTYDPTIPLKYICDVNGVIVEIHVRGDAIPPTCKLQEVDVVIPAQPERIEKRRVLVCPEIKPAPEPEPAAVPAEESSEPIAVEEPAEAVHA